MRRLGVLVVAIVPLVIAGCGKAPSQRDGQVADVSEGSTAPGVSVTSAPGVAFDYRYAFRVADQQVSAVQEAHAAACERLGIGRCRITGMHYTIGDSGQISGDLSFKLDPTIARGFGKDAIAIVEKSDGTLVEAGITGTDAAAAIATADGDATKARADIAAAEARIKTMPAGSERDELQAKVEAGRAQLADSTNVRADAQASLATTPMTFTYRSGRLVGGLDLRDAFATASSSFNAMLWFIIVAIGALLPWAALAAVGFYGFRFLRDRVGRARRPVVQVEATQ